MNVQVRLQDELLRTKREGFDEPDGMVLAWTPAYIVIKIPAHRYSGMYQPQRYAPARVVVHKVHGDVQHWYKADTAGNQPPAHIWLAGTGCHGQRGGLRARREPGPRDRRSRRPGPPLCQERRWLRRWPPRSYPATGAWPAASARASCSTKSLATILESSPTTTGRKVGTLILRKKPDRSCVYLGAKRLHRLGRPAGHVPQLRLPRPLHQHGSANPAPAAARKATGPEDHGGCPCAAAHTTEEGETMTICGAEITVWGALALGIGIGVLGELAAPWLRRLGAKHGAAVNRWLKRRWG